MKRKLDRKKWAKRLLRHGASIHPPSKESVQAIEALREKMRTKAPTEWHDSPPIEPGDYQFWCNESGRVDQIEVYLHNSELWVNCPDTGRNPLSIYHASLSNPKWRKPPPLTP